MYKPGKIPRSDLDQNRSIWNEFRKIALSLIGIDNIIDRTSIISFFIVFSFLTVQN